MSNTTEPTSVNLSGEIVEKTDTGHPSLSQYFSHSQSSDSFFDQLASPSSENSPRMSSDSAGSAMMTSVASSGSLYQMAQGMGSEEGPQHDLRQACLDVQQTCEDMTKLQRSLSVTGEQDPPRESEEGSASQVCDKADVGCLLQQTKFDTIPTEAGDHREGGGKETVDIANREGGGKETVDIANKGKPQDTDDEPRVCTIFSQVSNGGDPEGKAFFDSLASSSVMEKHGPGGMSGQKVKTATDSSFVPSLNQSFGVLSAPQKQAECIVDSYLTPSPCEDVFTNKLEQTEYDRRHDAWIPSHKTQGALTAIAASDPGTFFPEKDMLTMPGVVLEEEMADTVRELVSHYQGEGSAVKRNILTADSVTQDDRGLRELIQAGCYRAVVNLTGRLLSMYGQGAGKAGHPSKHTAHSIQLWYTRIAMLVKLREFSIAEVEAEPFGELDSPDLYFEYYPELYGRRKGSMIPFSFRLIVAELPQFRGKHQEALDRLYAILETVQKILENLSKGLCEDGSPTEMSASAQAESKKLWQARELRLMYSITNCAVYQKDFNLAATLMETVMEKEHQPRSVMYSALGRIYLQLGDVRGAQDAFNQAELTRGDSVLEKMQALTDLALIAVAQNAFGDAYHLFSQAAELQPGNAMLTNNMAVCLLYIGKLKEAICLLEGVITARPDKLLHESALVNVCTLYELESSDSNQKKLNMLDLVSQHKGDGINIACLKLQM